MRVSYTSILSFSISLLSVYFPFIRKIPIDINKRYNRSRKVIECESKRLIEEKYIQDKNNKLGNDLLSLLIKIKKTLPIEEKMTNDELKYQVVKKIYICLLYFHYYIYFYLILLYFFLFEYLDYVIFTSRT